MESLLLSLGHNSSAILVRDGHVVCGYEEERLSLVKSDSRFPKLAIEQCMKYSVEGIDGVYVSHWFPFGELPKNPNKYWNPFWLSENIPGSPNVYSVSMDFTHHDAHAWSAICFVGDSLPNEDTGIIVADGFGNFGECLSIYDLDSAGYPKIRHRSFGYDDSLGLMYQYATAFLNMKENQDEYKLLGYETRAHSLFNSIYDQITDEAIEHGIAQADRLLGDHKIGNPYDPMYAVDALPAIRLRYGQFFEKWIKQILARESLDAFETKVITSYYVQTRLEAALSKIAKSAGYRNLILVGGVFMNVKLNMVLASQVERISIMPLAGDQGASIGLFEAMTMMEGGFKWPEHLFWGNRDLSWPVGMDKPERFFHLAAESFAKHAICELLADNKIVNVVRGAMEFGARALCHTTTLAKATKENVAYINMCNARDTVMPMAPVVTQESLENRFVGYEKVAKSLDYMITALEYKDHSNAQGAANFYPATGSYTGRPQVTREQFVKDIIDSTREKILINTSFNEHGMPICYDIEDVIRCHNSQVDLDINDRITTVVISDE